jgi:hypothetical protein
MYEHERGLSDVSHDEDHRSRFGAGEAPPWDLPILNLTMAGALTGGGLDRETWDRLTTVLTEYNGHHDDEHPVQVRFGALEQPLVLTYLAASVHTPADGAFHFSTTARRAAPVNSAPTAAARCPGRVPMSVAHGGIVKQLRDAVA